MVSNPSNRIKTEAINEVILGLLGLKSGIEIYYQTYFEILKKKLSISNMAGGSLPREEEEILREELKRIRKIKDKAVPFKIKKVKVKTTSIPSSTRSNVSSGGGRPPKSSAIVKVPKGKIVPYTLNIQTDKKSKEDDFVSIRKTLDSILKILSSKFKFEQKQADVERKDKETEKRSKAESGLEGFKKGIGAIVSTTKKLLSPFQAVIDRIWRFIFFTLLGRGFTKFMEWMSNNENRKKFDSLVEFLSDHWPALAGLYVLFGTSFGKLVRGLLKGVVRMTVAIAMNIPRLIKFVKNKPRLAGLFASVAAAGSGYLSREVQGLFADKETPESKLIPNTNPELDDAKKLTDQAKNTPTPRISAANVGGIIPKLNFGGLIPSFINGSMNSYSGMNFEQGIPITGAGKDDTLIAAKQGEAVLTGKDQQDIGQRYVDRNTGEPLNIPQYLSGRKPGLVSMANIRPKFGGGFFGGGMIPGFNTGGIVGSNGNNNYPTSPITDYLWSKRQREAYSQMPVEKTYRMNEYQIMPNGLIDFMMPSWMKWQSIPDSLYPHTSYDKEDFEKGVRYNPFFQDLIRFPYLETKPREDIDYKMYYAPEGYNKYDPDYNTIQAQGGGLIPRLDKFGTSVFENVGGAVGRNRGTGIPGGGWFGNKFGRAKGRRVYERLTEPFRGMGGSGFIKENTGLNVRGATADRRAVFAQPGEYMLPLDFVSRIGGPSVLDRLVAMTDSNSTPFKQGVLSRPIITPYGSNSNMEIINLPPIQNSIGSSKARASGYAGGSSVPSFSVVSPKAMEDIAFSKLMYEIMG